MSGGADPTTDPSQMGGGMSNPYETMMQTPPPPGGGGPRMPMPPMPQYSSAPNISMPTPGMSGIPSMPGMPGTAPGGWLSGATPSMTPPSLSSPSPTPNLASLLSGAGYGSQLSPRANDMFNQFMGRGGAPGMPGGMPGGHPPIGIPDSGFGPMQSIGRLAAMPPRRAPGLSAPPQPAAAREAARSAVSAHTPTKPSRNRYEAV